MSDTITLAFSATTLSLSGIATIGIVAQAVRFKSNIVRYTLATAAGLCLMTSSVIGIVLNTTRHRMNAATFDSLIATFGFFLSVFLPLLWVIAFDTFRAVHPPRPNQDSTEPPLPKALICTFFGYLWAFAIIVIMIAKAAHERINGYNSDLFFICSLWVFLPLFAGQIYMSFSSVQPKISVSFRIYAFLLCLMVVGNTVTLAVSWFASIIVNFVLVELMGVSALIIFAGSGHAWVSPSHAAEAATATPPPSYSSEEEGKVYLL